MFEDGTFEPVCRLCKAAGLKMWGANPDEAGNGRWIGRIQT
jgi:hypothetical protein